MRNIILGMSAFALAAVATPAFAQEAETPAVTISGGATLVTDYRFRGISQTDKNFAVQGSLTLSHASGFYASVWGSTIDEYVAAGSDQEIDLIAGYKKSFGAVTVDVGALYYYYPGAEAFFPGYDSDFIEPYASISGAIGPVTAKVSAAYAPKQDAMLNVDNLYGAVDLSGAIPDTGVSLSAHLGHNFMDDSLLALGKKYTDWSVGASYSWKNLTFGVSYVDTNFDKGALSLLSPTGKDIAKAGVVGSIGVSF
ncbi:MAG: TorF family putative porin [Sphingobium sp.]|nr:TorF family putative porin [Sphingobium sp.]MBP6112470.1 TorF family putative porin [Sphingobium sp.]MBP8672112.1 TorF family putative porin [Sphingobium sp.]MBP9158826.1 TorF family putative porin [Sphingobium sp.]MCC6481712.1 hypothetical protein [Sphingomonadaceae bacterium]